jgi:hypothetical protein
MLLAPPDKTQAGFRYSARMRPEEPQLLPTEHMSMHVEHGLSRIGISVEHNPIPTGEDALKLGNLTSSSNNITQQGGITGSKLGKVPIPLPGHNKHVNPSLRPNIPEGKGGLILIDNISGDLTGNDPLEESLVLTHRTNPSDKPTPVPSQTTRVPSRTTRGEGPKGRRPEQGETPFEREKHKSRGGPGLAPAGGLGG